MHSGLAEFEFSVLFDVDMDKGVSQYGDDDGLMLRIGVEVGRSHVGGVRDDVATVEGGMYNTTNILTNIAADDTTTSIVQTNYQ